MSLTASGRTQGMPWLVLLYYCAYRHPALLHSTLAGCCVSVCSGEVALTRAADEECLQIVHVWRPEAAAQQELRPVL